MSLRLLNFFYTRVFYRLWRGLFSYSCLVEITRRLMCDNIRALLLPSFSDCAPVKKPLKALPILGRLCMSTNIPHTYKSLKCLFYASCHSPYRLGVLPVVTLFRRGCLSAMSGCFCLVCCSLSLLVISCLWFVFVMLLCFGLVVSLRSLLFLTSLSPFSSSIMYRRYSNFSMTTDLFQYWLLPYGCTVTWSPSLSSIRSWAFLS